MTWRVIKTISCGCEVIQLQVDSDHGGYALEQSLRHTGMCISHLCRLCGDVPSADGEPDRLCHNCLEDG